MWDGRTDGRQVKIELLSFWSGKRWVSQYVLLCGVWHCFVFKSWNFVPAQQNISACNQTASNFHITPIHDNWWCQSVLGQDISGATTFKSCQWKLWKVTLLKTKVPLETIASNVKVIIVTFLKVLIMIMLIVSMVPLFDVWCLCLMKMIFCELCPSWRSLPSCTSPSRSKPGRSSGLSLFWSPGSTWLVNSTANGHPSSAINMFTMIKLHDQPHWSPPSCCRWRGMQWGKPRRSRRQLSKWRSPGGYLLNKMRIMCSEVGLGDEDVEKVWSSFTVLMTLN